MRSYCSSYTLETSGKIHCCRGGYSRRKTATGDVVYDITSFALDHPGGSIIRDAAGGPIENYWAYWAYHYDAESVPIFLSQCKIGELVFSSKEEEEQHTPNQQELQNEHNVSDPDRDLCMRNGQIMSTSRL